MRKIMFNQEARIDGEVAFEKDSVHVLEDSSADRWIRRGAAVPHFDEEDEELEETLSKIDSGSRIQDETILKKLDAAIEGEEEAEDSEGMAKDGDDSEQDKQDVAKEAGKGQNGKAKSSKKTNQRGL